MNAIINNVKRFGNLYSENVNVSNVHFDYLTNTMILDFYNKPSLIVFTALGWSITTIKTNN
jgi:hypothetical protein